MVSVRVAVNVSVSPWPETLMKASVVMCRPSLA